MREFREKLKELMKEHNNISPEKLEKELEKNSLFVSANAIRGYLKGKYPQNMQYYFNLAEYFKVSPMYLIDNNVTNRNCSNIEVGKELGLSDIAINMIKSIDDKSMLNYFLKNFDFKRFIDDLRLYYQIEKILNYDLKIIIYICDIWEYILDRKERNKQEDLKEYFNKYDDAVFNIVNFNENTSFFDPSDSKYDLFKEAYISLKNDIFNKQIEYGGENVRLQDKLEELLDLHEEISERYEMYSKIIKLSITDMMNSFLYYFEKMYNVTLGSEDYKEMFGKYIEYINSDIREDYKFYSNRFKTNKIL